MPDDVLYIIFDYIDSIKSIYNTGRTCKRFMYLMQQNTRKRIESFKLVRQNSIMGVDITAGSYAFLYNYIKSMLCLQNDDIGYTGYEPEPHLLRFRQRPEMVSIPDIDHELTIFIDKYKTPIDKYNSPIIRAVTEIFDNTSEEQLKGIFDNVGNVHIVLPDRREPYHFLSTHFTNMNIFAGVRKIFIGHSWVSNEDESIDVDFSLLKNVDRLTVHNCILSEHQLYDIAKCNGFVQLYRINMTSLRPLSERKQLSLDNTVPHDNDYHYLSNYDKLDITYNDSSLSSVNSDLRYIKHLKITNGHIEKGTIFHCDELDIEESTVASIYSILNTKKLILSCVTTNQSDKIERDVLFTSEFVDYMSSQFQGYNQFITDLNIFMNVKFLSLNSDIWQSSEELRKLKNVYALRLYVIPRGPLIISLKDLENVKLLWIYDTRITTYIDMTGLISLKFLYYRGRSLTEDMIQQIPSLVRHNCGVSNWNGTVDTFDTFYERYLNGERW